MGIENYLLPSSLVAVLAQRLVRVLCSQCKRPERIAGPWLRSVGFAATENQYEIHRAAGCEHCAHTGYRGRVGIFELMDLDEEIRKRILANEDASALAKTARERGMRTLLEDGWEKVRAGATSPEEVLRVTQAL